MGKKDLKYYLKLKWSYTIESESEGGRDYYIIRVNELPGVCTDAETIEQGLKNVQEAIRASLKLYLKHGEPIPEPIKKEAFSKTLDIIIDKFQLGSVYTKKEKRYAKK